MEQKIQAYLASPSRDFLELLRAALERQPDLAVVGASSRGDEALAALSERSPDVLVTDLLLPGLDGLSLLRRLKEMGKLPRTVVVSAFSNDRVAQAASRLGVEDYFLKPCDFDALIDRIREAALPTGRRAVREYDPAIREALREFGIPLNLDGHKYLMEGTRMALEDRNVLCGVTKILYPDLARHFGTTAHCVERSIRGAIDRAWKRMTPEGRSRCYGGAFAGDERAPGNARFVGALVEHVEAGYEKLDVWKSR